jgi:DNA-binding XRE family transcriptional regulator
MGDMYDFAVNTVGMTLSSFHEMFIMSGMSYQIEIGNPTYVAGKNGCEVAREVIHACSDIEVGPEDVMYLDKSAEYWIGWALAYYQWISGKSFEAIDECIKIDKLYGMYNTLHEADISLFVEIMDEKFREHREESMLKRLRMYAGLSQRALADKAGVPLRQIQLFEQEQRDINKTQGATLYQLSSALGCSMERLLKR